MSYIFPTIKPNFINNITLSDYNNLIYDKNFKGSKLYTIPTQFNTSGSQIVLRYDMRDMTTVDRFKTFWYEVHFTYAFTIPNVVFDYAPSNFPDFISRELGTSFRMSAPIKFIPKIINNQYKLYDFTVQLVSVVA